MEYLVSQGSNIRLDDEALEFVVSYGCPNAVEYLCNLEFIYTVFYSIYVIMIIGLCVVNHI